MSYSQKSLVKIIRPVFPDILLRERLFDYLDKSLKKPIVWVTGPAGAGKSALVSTYIDSRKIPHIWYRIDETDSDITQVFNYMNLACEKIIRKGFSSLAVYKKGYRGNITNFSRRYFEELFSRIERKPFIFVFDNYQEQPEGSVFSKVLNVALLKIPEEIKVVIISRGDIPSNMARIRTNYLPDVLGWKELKLTYEESEKIIKKRIKKHSNEMNRFLYRRTNGWVAGLMLILERMKLEDIDPLRHDKPLLEDVYDYFRTEILEKIGQKKQDFLLKTALLPRVTPQMAEELTGYKHSGKMLKDLYRGSCFIEQYLYSEKVYQYLPIFREFLLDYGMIVFKKEGLKKIQRRTASILARSGLIEDAAVLLCKVGKWEELSRLIYKNANSLLKRGRHKILDDWLSRIPENIVETTPWLLYWKARCHMPFNPKDSYRDFKNAFKLFCSFGDVSGICMAWSGAVESLISDTRFMSLDQWITILEDQIKHFKVFPSKEIEAHVTSCMYTAIVLRYPDHPEIGQWEERVFSLLQDCLDIGLKIQTLFYMAWHKLYQGDFAGTSIILNLLREIVESKTMYPIDLLKLKEIEALYYWLIAMHNECKKAVSEGLELARITGVHKPICNLLGHGVANALSMGDLTTSKRLLHKMASIIKNEQAWNKSYYYFLKAWEALLERDMIHALINSELAVKCAREAGILQTEAICYIEKAQVMHEMGEEKKAEEFLRYSKEIGDKIKSQLIKHMCLLTESQFTFARDEDEKGVVLLDKAMKIGKRLGYVNMFIWRASDMARLCAKAIEAGIEVEYVQELIKKRGLVHQTTSIHIENWPWPLKIYTLGRFSLVKDGNTVRFSRKAQRKPLYLLKALITLGGRGVSEEQFLDILWYDADGDVAHKSFATTLHRLRRLVGNDRIVQLSEGRLTLDSRYCWVDVWAFERMIGQIETVWKGRVKKEDKMAYIIKMAEKAIEMYKGPFLVEEMDQQWTISFRERIRSKFLRIVNKLGHYWEEVGNFEKAVSCYQRGLEVDDLAEEFYQRLMICYSRLGRKAETLSVYNKCCNTLSNVLGIKPSRTTENIYISIFNKK